MKRAENVSSEFWHLSKSPEGMPADRLNVVFSARAIKPGNFSMWKFMHRIAGHTLFLNCAKNAWYQNDIDAISAKIDEVRRITGASRCRYIGISMGAYATCVFACRDPESSAFAFSPNLILQVPFTHSWYYRMEVDPRYVDLLPLLQSVRPGKLHIFLGARDVADSCFIRDGLAAGLENFHPLESRHGTGAILDRIGLLEPMLQSDDLGFVERAALPRCSPDAIEWSRSIYERYCEFFHAAADERDLSRFLEGEEARHRLRRFGIVSKLLYDLQFVGKYGAAGRLLSILVERSLLTAQEIEKHEARLAVQEPQRCARKDRQAFALDRFESIAKFERTKMAASF